ncbi:efflux transporter outer membrane subunit [Methylomicrobium sp. Wu6]|uniref:efflux transporter outer membrane subunit n=1 Tax=Methylomicrobium sp. Wu6 TaxID=3107928 RepID=UPI002DD665CA|nr:efflux transporter outer membrane subunit [Methylomicrobium sp. Wu6]MEC4747237.1 efflux transporter outer membrane subunit [Methylomicrobium sp. Wu6]
MRNLSLLLLIAMLSGCFKVGPDYRKPQVDTPQTWRFAEREGKDTSNLPWWEQFGDPVLNRLVERGIQGNLDLKVAIANVEQFMGQYGATRANLFPQIFGAANYAHAQPSRGGGDVLSSGTNNNEVDFARLGASMQWEIDVWGGLRRAKEAAQADLLSQEAVKRGVILTLASAIAQTYVQLRTFDKDLEITRAVVQTLKEDLHIRRVRFQEGYTSELEVTQAESEYERRSALIPFYEQSVAQTEHALSVLLGKNPGPIERGRSFDELMMPAVPAGLPSELLARRPDIQQAEQALVAANARIGVAKAQYFPKISLTGDVGQISTQVASLFAPGANFWTVGSALLTPIFTAGKIAGQVQTAEGAQQAALANYRRAIINAFREFEDSLVGGIKTKQRSEKQARRVAAVENYYNLSRKRYDEGYTDYLTVLDAVRNLFDAQIDLIQARSDNFTASIGLYRAMGGGWILAAEKTLQPAEPAEASMFP